MIPVAFRNFMCATGLILGLSLIASANAAQAQVQGQVQGLALPCSAEDSAGVTEDGLPIICERFIITAPAHETVLDRLRDLALAHVNFGDMLVRPELPGADDFQAPMRRLDAAS